MATVPIRYLTIRPSRAPGGLPRYYWQPRAELAPLFVLTRVPEDYADYHDPVALQAAAIAAALALNAALDQWRAAPRTAAPPAPAPETRDVAALIRDYRASRDFKSKAAKTRYEYGRCLDIIEAWAGSVPVRAMRKPRFVKFYEALYGTDEHPGKPAKAKAVMVVARLLFSHAGRIGWCTENPAAKLKLAGSAPSGIIWPREAVLAFVATADRVGRPSIGDAVLLNEWLGQREADVLALPPTLVGPKGLVVRQHKTAAGVRIPVWKVPHLVARVEAARARHAAAGRNPTRLVISEDAGRPYTPSHFRHVFTAVRDALAAELDPATGRPWRFPLDYIPAAADPDDPLAETIGAGDLWFMHLRHTAVVREAEAGATNAEIAAITGHKLATVHTILERYLVRTGELAGGAFDKRLAKEQAR